MKAVILGKGDAQKVVFSFKLCHDTKMTFIYLLVSSHLDDMTRLLVTGGSKHPWLDANVTTEIIDLSDQSLDCDDLSFGRETRLSFLLS